MTIKQASVVLGLKVRTIRSWVAKGILPATKVGKYVIISDDILLNEEVHNRANENRKYSHGVKKGQSVGMLAGGGKNPEESV